MGFAACFSDTKLHNSVLPCGNPELRFSELDPRVFLAPVRHRCAGSAPSVRRGRFAALNAVNRPRTGYN